MAQVRPGVWRLRVYVGRNAETGAPRHVRRTFNGNETAARRALAQLVTEHQQGRFDGHNQTLGQLLDRWIRHIEPTRAPKTVHEYKAKIEGRIRPVLGTVRLDRLTPAVLDRAYGDWLAEVSPSTVRALHRIISAALNQAVRWGEIVNNPAARTTPPAQRTMQITVPEPAEIIAMIRKAEDDEEDSMLATAIALAALTGARRGELCALRWSDVDLPGARLTIRNSLTVVDGVMYIGPTKTHQVRTLALDELALAVLQRRWEYQEELADMVGVRLARDPYVLSLHGAGADPVPPNVLSHRFKKLPRSIHLHQLRHFPATQMVASGVDLRTAASRLGHADPALTLRVYAHALPEQDRTAAAMLGNALRSTTK